MNALYGLKFIAFIFIFFHHLAFPNSLGSNFTTFFFVFAGFITAYNFKRKNFNPNKKEIKDFYVNKLIKNYPIYIITLIISIPYVLKASGFTFSIKDLITHTFMLQTLSPQGNKTFLFNGLSWFLADLMIFYLLIPFIYRLFKKFKINSNIKYLLSLISLFVLEVLFSIPFSNMQIVSYSFKWWLLYISPISRMLNLLIGFVFGLYFVDNQNRLTILFKKLPKYVVFIIELFALLSIFINVKFLNFIPISYSVNGTKDLPMSLILIVVFGIGTGFISKILGSKLFVYLGKLSLPCYMFHQVIINYLVLCCFSRPWYNTDISFKRNLFNALFILTIVVCISDVFQKFILTPTTNYLMKLSKRKKVKKIKINNNNKLNNVVFYILGIIFLFCLTFIIISNIINKNVLFINYNLFIIFIGIITYLGIIYLMFKLVNKLNIKKNKLFNIFMIIYIILQFLVITLLKVNPSWDFGVVLNIVSDNLNKNIPISNSLYLYQFQNNVVFAYILKILLIPFKLLKFKNYLVPAMIINAAIIDIGIIFIYNTIKLLFKDKSVYLFTILLFLFQPILLYVPIIYTDTIAFSLVAIIVYFITYLLTNKDKLNSENNLFKCILLGIIIGISIQIKFTIIILFIAFVIIALFTDFKKYIKSLLLSFASLFIVVISISSFISFKFDNNTLNQIKVPATHWIMMGLSNNGNYNVRDYQMTFESGNYDDKVNFNKKEITKRIKDHIDKNNLVQFYTKKTSFLWNDGSYYLPELLKLAKNKNIIHEFILPGNKYFNIYMYYNQIKHILMLLIIAMLPVLSKNDKKNNVIKNFFLTSIIGYFLFFTIWEVSSRYLFHIIPLLLITYFYGLNLIKKILDKKHI